MNTGPQRSRFQNIKYNFVWQSRENSCFTFPNRFLHPHWHTSSRWQWNFKGKGARKKKIDIQRYTYTKHQMLGVHRSDTSTCPQLTQQRRFSINDQIVLVVVVHFSVRLFFFINAISHNWFRVYTYNFARKSHFAPIIMVMQFTQQITTYLPDSWFRRFVERALIFQYEWMNWLNNYLFSVHKQGETKHTHEKLFWLVICMEYF